MRAAGKKLRAQSANSFWDRIATSEEVQAARDLRVTRSDTRARLLAAALERFASHGFTATTMRELATDVGIKAPAIYSHFESKEQILGLALVWAMDDFNGAVLRTDEGDLDAIERLRRILGRHIAYHLANPIVARAFDVLVSSQILNRLDQTEYQTELIKRLKLYVSTVRHLIEEITARHASHIDARLAAHAITTMYDQVSRWHHSGSAQDDRDIVDTYWGFVCRMLQAPENAEG